MKNTRNILLIAIVIILQSCSTNEDNDGSSQEPTIITKSVSSIFPSSEDMYVLTESGLITKFYSNGTTYYHHVQYNANSRVQAMYIDGTGNTSIPFRGFDFDYITGNTNPPDVEFRYSGNVLTEISGISNVKFIYDNTGKLIETLGGNLNDNRAQFIYDGGENPVAVIESNIFDANSSKRWELTFDDKVNPLYKPWVENSFPYFVAENGLTSRSYVYFKNNLIKKEQLATSQQFVINYQYDNDNHPTFYRFITEQGNTRSGTINYVN